MPLLPGAERGNPMTFDYERRVKEIYEELRREATYPVGSEYDRDDRETALQCATLERVAEKRRLGLFPPLPPVPSTPKKSLIQAGLELGWIDARPEWQRQGLPTDQHRGRNVDRAQIDGPYVIDAWDLHL